MNISEILSESLDESKPSFEIQKKPGEDYWYVKRGAVTLGVISKGSKEGYDADTDPNGGGQFKKGFDSVKAAARWIMSNNGSKGEDVEDQFATDLLGLEESKGVSKRALKDYIVKAIKNPKTMNNLSVYQLAAGFERSRGRRFDGTGVSLAQVKRQADHLVKKGVLKKTGDGSRATYHLVGTRPRSGEPAPIRTSSGKWIRPPADESIDDDNLDRFAGDLLSEGGLQPRYAKDGKNLYVDTDFVNVAKDALPGYRLQHMGFGEFSLKGPEGEIEFDKMRGKPFAGMTGRSHKVYGPKVAVDKLMKAMKSKAKKSVMEDLGFSHDRPLHEEGPAGNRLHEVMIGARHGHRVTEDQLFEAVMETADIELGGQPIENLIAEAKSRPPASVRNFLLLLSHKITRADMAQKKRDTKKGRPFNDKALPLMLDQVNKIEKRMKGKLNSTDPKDLKELKSLIKRHFTPGTSPAEYTMKAIDKVLAGQPFPKITGKGGQAPAWR